MIFACRNDENKREMSKYLTELFSCPKSQKSWSAQTSQIMVKQLQTLHTTGKGVNGVQAKRGRMGRQDETGIQAERNAEEECGERS